MVVGLEAETCRSRCDPTHLALQDLGRSVSGHGRTSQVTTYDYVELYRGDGQFLTFNISQVDKSIITSCQVSFRTKWDLVGEPAY